MTSKISCFDHAVFRRALKMTAPVWILYTLYELLLPLRLFSFCRGLSSGADNYIVQIEKTLLSYARFNASIVPFLLGGLLAWVLFSWLFRAGTAYFYAALPVRRETLFLTNYLTGVLLCAAPALLSSLLLWAVGAGFGAAEFDLFGYSRYLPERGAVQAAGLTHYQSSGLYTTQDDVFVQDVLALHAAAIAEKGAQEHRRHAYQLGADYTEQFYITYRMADGTLTERYYSIVYNDAELKDPDSLISRFSALYNSPVCVRIRAGFDTPRTEKSVLSCYVSSYDTGADLELTGSDAWRVYEACLDDINAGLLGAADVSGSTKQSDGSNYTPLTLIFTVSTDVPGQTDSLYVDSIPLSAAETVSALQALGADPYWRAAG